MRVKVRITLNPAKILELQKAVETSREQAAEAIKSDIISSAVVPKEEGALERSIAVIRSGSRFRIVFNTPYARRLYWHPEYNFRRDKNPNAQGLWMQKYIDGSKKDLYRKLFVHFLKQNAGGLIK